MSNEWLVIFGSVCFTLAMIEAWLLVIISVKPDSFIAQAISGTQDLLKSHIDYLLMALFLFVFYMLFAHFSIKVSAFLLICMCLGAVGNAGLFLVRAINPQLKTQPTQNFQLIMGISCLLTTIGFLGGAWAVALQAIHVM
jgi:hypothetical protein